MSIGIKHPNRGERIKMCRCRCSMTMTEVALALNIDLDLYKSYECDEVSVPDSIMFKCSKILKAPELMCGINPSKFRYRRRLH